MSRCLPAAAPILEGEISTILPILAFYPYFSPLCDLDLLIINAFRERCDSYVFEL